MWEGDYQPLLLCTVSRLLVSRLLVSRILVSRLLSFRILMPRLLVFHHLVFRILVYRLFMYRHPVSRCVFLLPYRYPYHHCSLPITRFLPCSYQALFDISITPPILRCNMIHSIRLRI